MLSKPKDFTKGPQAGYKVLSELSKKLECALGGRLKPNKLTWENQ